MISRWENGQLMISIGSTGRGVDLHLEADRQPYGQHERQPPADRRGYTGDYEEQGRFAEDSASEPGCSAVRAGITGLI